MRQRGRTCRTSWVRGIVFRYDTTHSVSDVQISCSGQHLTAWAAATRPCCSCVRAIKRRVVSSRREGGCREPHLLFQCGAEKCRREKPLGKVNRGLERRHGRVRRAVKFQWRLKVPPRPEQRFRPRQEESEKISVRVSRRDSISYSLITPWFERCLISEGHGVVQWSLPIHL